MKPETFLALFVLGIVAALGVLAVLDELRQRRIRSPRAPDNVFRCTKCSLIYTDDHGVERSRCPQCGLTNGVFQF